MPGFTSPMISLSTVATIRPDWRMMPISRSDLISMPRRLLLMRGPV